MLEYKIAWKTVELIESEFGGALVVDTSASPTLTDNEGRVYSFVVEATVGEFPTAKATMEALGRKAVVFWNNDLARYYLFAVPVPEEKGTIRIE